MTSKNTRKIQMGVESTPGTAVAATNIWRGLGMPQDDREVVFVDEDVGIAGGTDRTYIAKYLASLELESTPATFEQLPYLLEMGLMTATPAQDGTGPYVYTYTLPSTSQPAIKTYTFEGGDSQEVVEIEYGHLTEMTLEGSGGEAWMMSGTVSGRQTTVSGFTSDLTLPSVEEILFGKTSLYIDDSTGAFGGTIKAAVLHSATLTITPGWEPNFLGDNLYFTNLAWGKPEITLEVVFEHIAAATAEIVAWKAQTTRGIRLQAVGSAIAGGSTYTTKTLQINLPGKWEKFEKITEVNGNDVVAGTFKWRYNAALGAGSIVIANGLSALV